MANYNLKPKSIEEQGGIEDYLSDKRHQHNGYTATDLRKFVAARVPVAVIGRLMSNNPNEPRSVNTVKSWIKLLEANK